MAKRPGVDTKALEQAMARVPDALFAHWRSAFFRILAKFHTHHSQFVFASQYTGGLSNKLQSRTGTLRRSFTPRVTGATFKSLLGIYGTSLVYAAAHEYGATITPKRVRYLTIPFAEGLTPSGVSRRKARQWTPSFITRGKKNPRNLILWWAGKDPPVPVMVLTEGPVKIKPRLKLADTWRKFTPTVDRMLNEATSAALREARR